MTVTDVVKRLITVETANGTDIALYAAQELFTLIGSIRDIPNTVTKKFDYSGAYRVFIVSLCNSPILRIV